jgi:hypothetical protein
MKVPGRPHAGMWLVVVVAGWWWVRRSQLICWREERSREPSTVARCAARIAEKRVANLEVFPSQRGRILQLKKKVFTASVASALLPTCRGKNVEGLESQRVRSSSPRGHTLPYTKHRAAFVAAPAAPHGSHVVLCLALVRMPTPTSHSSHLPPAHTAELSPALPPSLPPSASHAAYWAGKILLFVCIRC